MGSYDYGWGSLWKYNVGVCPGSSKRGGGGLRNGHSQNKKGGGGSLERVHVGAAPKTSHVRAAPKTSHVRAAPKTSHVRAAHKTSHVGATPSAIPPLRNGVVGADHGKGGGGLYDGTFTGHRSTCDWVTPPPPGYDNIGYVLALLKHHLPWLSVNCRGSACRNTHGYLPRVPLARMQYNKNDVNSQSNV